jgi:hypothetical protein
MKDLINRMETSIAKELNAMIDVGPCACCKCVSRKYVRSKVDGGPDVAGIDASSASRPNIGISCSLQHGIK